MLWVCLISRTPRCPDAPLTGTPATPYHYASTGQRTDDCGNDSERRWRGSQDRAWNRADPRKQRFRLRLESSGARKVFFSAGAHARYSWSGQVMETV
jgi:hypothetical protein